MFLYNHYVCLPAKSASVPLTRVNSTQQSALVCVQPANKLRHLVLCRPKHSLSTTCPCRCASTRSGKTRSTDPSCTMREWETKWFIGGSVNQVIRVLFMATTADLLRHVRFAGALLLGRRWSGREENGHRRKRVSSLGSVRCTCHKRYAISVAISTGRCWEILRTWRR